MSVPRAQRKAVGQQALIFVEVPLPPTCETCGSVKDVRTDQCHYCEKYPPVQE